MKIDREELKKKLDLGWIEKDHDPAKSPEHGISALAEARRLLEANGIEIEGEGYRSVGESAKRLLIAEAVNWAAKKIDPGFYALKPYVFAEAAILGAADGVQVFREYDEESGYTIWAVHHKEVGELSFHDKYDEIAPLLDGAEVLYSAPYVWSGISRQPEAFNTLRDPLKVKELATAAAPRYIEGEDNAPTRVVFTHDIELTNPAIMRQQLAHRP